MMREAKGDEIASSSIADLFAGLLRVAFCGVVPWVRRIIVEQRNWQTPVEFTDMLSLCSFLSGGNTAAPTMQ